MIEGAVKYSTMVPVEKKSPFHRILWLGKRNRNSKTALREREWSEARQNTRQKKTSGGGRQPGLPTRSGVVDGVLTNILPKRNIQTHPQLNLNEGRRRTHNWTKNKKKTTTTKQTKLKAKLPNKN